MQENKRNLKQKVTFMLVILAVALGLYVIWHTQTAPRTDDAYVSADTIGVSPEVSGRIINLAVKDNQQVKKGDLLFQIDPRPFQNALDMAKANLNALNHEIELTQRTINAQKLSADAAKANTENARAALDQANDTLNRMEPLQNQHYVSAEQVDQARTAKRTAKASLNTAMLEAERARAGISGVDALVAKRDVLNAAIVLAKLNLEYTTVRAPFDGVVINLKTSIGQFAASGHPVFTLANTTKWYVIANFRETELEKIKPGIVTQIYVLSDPSKRFSGTVKSVGYGVFPDDGGNDVEGLPHVTRTLNWVRVAQRFPVRIVIDKPDGALLRIGESAVVILAPVR